MTDSAARPGPRPALEPVPMPITTDRLIIRPYTRDDAAALSAGTRASYEHLRPWMPWASADQSTEDSEEIIAGMIGDWSTRSDLTLGIFDRATGGFLGGSGLHRIDWDARCFEIGYWIAAEHEGQGYVTEAAGAIAAFAFDELRAERVEIRLDAANARSQAVPERLGFRHEGTLRSNARAVGGELRDTEIYALIRSDERSRLVR